MIVIKRDPSPELLNALKYGFSYYQPIVMLIPHNDLTPKQIKRNIDATIALPEIPERLKLYRLDFDPYDPTITEITATLKVKNDTDDTKEVTTHDVMFSDGANHFEYKEKLIIDRIAPRSKIYYTFDVTIVRKYDRPEIPNMQFYVFNLSANTNVLKAKVLNSTIIVKDYMDKLREQCRRVLDDVIDHVMENSNPKHPVNDLIRIYDTDDVYHIKFINENEFLKAILIYELSRRSSSNMVLATVRMSHKLALKQSVDLYVKRDSIPFGTDTVIKMLKHFRTMI